MSKRQDEQIGLWLISNNYTKVDRADIENRFSNIFKGTASERLAKLENLFSGSSPWLNQYKYCAETETVSLKKSI